MFQLSCKEDWIIENFGKNQVCKFQKTARGFNFASFHFSQSNHFLPIKVTLLVAQLYLKKNIDVLSDIQYFQACDLVYLRQYYFVILNPIISLIKRFLNKGFYICLNTYGVTNLYCLINFEQSLLCFNAMAHSNTRHLLKKNLQSQLYFSSGYFLPVRSINRVECVFNFLYKMKSENEYSLFEGFCV